MTHHLAEKNPETRTATCSVCGPVGMTRSGTGWVCSEKAKKASREWRRKNPEKLNRQSKSEHTLLSQNLEARTGVCPVDGEVGIVPWGRGWTCGVRAKELGRIRRQEHPQRYCRDCIAADRVLVWVQSGGCPRCAETDLNMEFAKQAADRRAMKSLQEQLWTDVAGHTVGMSDPYWMEEYESAVPGWKTIGSRD